MLINWDEILLKFLKVFYASIFLEMLTSVPRVLVKDLKLQLFMKVCVIKCIENWKL